MSSITVFCPNARRQQIKVQPNTKIIEILEEVCKKQGFVPNEHELVYQKRSLDLTLTFRLSGISNNAVIDLKKLESGPRQFDNVTISLQLEDGSRLQPKEFKSDSTSLFNIIEFYSNSNADSQVLTDALNQDLSLQTGNYPTINYLNEQVIGIPQLKATSLKDLGLTSGRFILKLLHRKLDKEQYDTLMAEFEAKQVKKTKLEEIFKKKQEQELEYSKLNEAKPRVEQPIAEPQLIKHQQEIALEKSVQKQVSKKPKIEEMEIEQREQEIPIVENQFLNFKFPEETKGKVLNNVNELAEIERISKEACDRMSILFSLEENRDNTEQNELGDEFFDVTVQDIRLMLSDLKRTQNEDAPLMTKQMRELEKDRKAMKYAKIVVRIAFKNRMVLQGLFRPKELLSELYAFVKNSLSEENQADELDFYLFSTPPKTILKDMKMTLFDANLCPAALIYFKNKTDTVPVFKNDILLKKMSEAEEIVEIHVHQAIRDIKHEGLDWIQKDQVVVQNLLKSSGLTSRQESKTSDYESTSRRDQTREEDPVKNKLEKFLKGSKKF